MQFCCCSLAGTEACKYCSANGATGRVSIWTNNRKEDSINHKKSTDYKSFEDTWEIPHFMLRRDSSDS